MALVRLGNFEKKPENYLNVLKKKLLKLNNVYMQKL